MDDKLKVLNVSRGAAARQTAKAARGLVRAAVVTAAVVRRRTREHYRDVVLSKPFSQQKEWLQTPEAIAAMGAEWCNRKLRRLDDVEQRLKNLVPSGAWLEAAWSGTAPFPPQEVYCPLSAVAVLYGMAARGELKPRAMMSAFHLLFQHVDPIQVVARAHTRMRLSQCHTSHDTGMYDDNRQPIPSRPTQRLTPPQAVDSEDHFDRMSVNFAQFCPDPPSCSAAIINKIGMTRGRDQSAIDREKKKRRAARRRTLDAIKAKHGIEDDGPAADSHDDDEELGRFMRPGA